MVGSLLVAIQAGGSAMPVMKPANVAVDVGMNSKPDEEFENEEVDEALIQNALCWMGKD